MSSSPAQALALYGGYIACIRTDVHLASCRYSVSWCGYIPSLSDREAYIIPSITNFQVSSQMSNFTMLFCQQISCTILALRSRRWSHSDGSITYTAMTFPLTDTALHHTILHCIKGFCTASQDSALHQRPLHCITIFCTASKVSSLHVHFKILCCMTGFCSGSSAVSHLWEPWDCRCQCCAAWPCWSAPQTWACAY